MLRTVFRFSEVAQIAYKLNQNLTDCVVLRGAATDTPHVVIDNNIFNLNELRKKTTAYFRCKDFSIYHQSVPSQYIYGGSFYLEFKETNELYFVAGNDDLVEDHFSSEFAETDCPPMLEQICEQTVSELENYNSMTPRSLHTLLTKNSLHNTKRILVQKARLKELLKFVEKKIHIYDHLIEPLDKELLRKANWRVSWLMKAVVAQIGILHYFIYYSLSWDIMEPITVILANVDLCFAYCYFLKYGKDYSFQAYTNSLVDKKRKGYLIAKGINMDHYEELKEIKENLEMKLGLMSKNPEVVMKTLSKPIKLFDQS